MHYPVLLKEIISIISPQYGGTFIDCTFGQGGYAKKILEFPNTKIILAHWGGGAPFYELMPEVSKAFRNVYYDCAATPYLYATSIFNTVEGIVSHRKILFGTDYPVISQGRVLKDLNEAFLSESVKCFTLSRNAKEVFNLQS